MEEVDPKFPKPKGEELLTHVYFDSNWAHDETTRKSILGCIAFVGNTPIMWMSKRIGVGVDEVGCPSRGSWYFQDSVLMS